MLWGASSEHGVLEEEVVDTMCQFKIVPNWNTKRGTKRGKGETSRMFRAQAPSCMVPRGLCMSTPLLILSPLLGTPDNEGVTHQFRSLVGPQEGKGDPATADFVPFSGNPENAEVT